MYFVIIYLISSILIFPKISLSRTKYVPWVYEWIYDLQWIYGADYTEKVQPGQRFHPGCMTYEERFEWKCVFQIMSLCCYSNYLPLLNTSTDPTCNFPMQSVLNSKTFRWSAKKLRSVSEARNNPIFPLGRLKVWL